MFSHLRSPRVNLQMQQESACRGLVEVLEKIDGTKAILVDETLFGSLWLIASRSIFADRGIKVFKLNANSRVPKGITNIIYIVRPHLPLMDIIAKQVKESGHSYHLFFVPRISCLSMNHLKNEKVDDLFRKVDELPWNFFPVDSDVVSMELPHAFHDIAVDGDPTALYQAAVGLVQLQRLYGRIPKIYGKGNNSQRVWEYAKQLGSEEKLFLNCDKGAIDQLILLDRSIDFMSALATQLTYEGLVDEFYGIQQNQLIMPADLFAHTEEPSTAHLEKKTFFLNSADKLYEDLRNKNFNEVGKTLSKTANEISVEMKTSKQDNSVQEMKRLVDKLPALLAQKKALAVHTTIAEMIRKQLDSHAFSDDLVVEQEFMVCENTDKPSAYIEDLIAQKCDMRNVLRLMCIQCAAASGFKEKVLNYYKRELAQVYGIKVLLTISNLEKAGLLQTQSESRAYSVLRKTLNLTVENAIEVNPQDISYVHSFYAPLTVRIVEQTLKPLGWQSLKSQINNLQGQTFEDFQAQLIGIGGRQSSTPSERTLLNIPRVVLVFFVGGCTHAEIAALRFLSRQEDNNVEFVVATTAVINKNTFLDNLM